MWNRMHRMPRQRMRRVVCKSLETAENIAPTSVKRSFRLRGCSIIISASRYRIETEFVGRRLKVDTRTNGWRDV
jgi:hypothetical protein